MERIYYESLIFFKIVWKWLVKGECKFICIWLFCFLIMLINFMYEFLVIGLYICNGMRIRIVMIEVELWKFIWNIFVKIFLKCVEKNDSGVCYS